MSKVSFVPGLRRAAAVVAARWAAPRSRLSTTPYRGPYMAGYQSGTPWIDLSNDAKLGNMLDFMLESQLQFRSRHPQALLGPFMHCYLPATWDSVQTGDVDTWVWDAPDGNPAWTGWQWRAFDAMAHTWHLAVSDGSTQTEKAAIVATRFLTWLHGWLSQHRAADYLPSEWGPPGWTMGVPLPPNSYLDPRGTVQEPHDIALALKGALYCHLAGASRAMCRYVIARCVRALRSTQVATENDPMKGAFTLFPADFVAFGFAQGEIHDALALALQHKDLLDGLNIPATL